MPKPPTRSSSRSPTPTGGASSRCSPRRVSATATGLAAELPITRQAVAKHLGALERARLVSRRRAGRETHYALDADSLATVSEWVDSVGAEWDGRLRRLERTLDSR